MCNPNISPIVSKYPDLRIKGESKMSSEATRVVTRPIVTINTLLLINGILTAFYAVLLLFMPATFFEMRAMPGDAIAIFMARLLAPSQVGYAVLSIVASRLQNLETLRLVTIVNFITWTLGLIVFLVGKLTLEMNALVWVDIAFAVIFSSAFAYFVFARSKS
jgi:hypothetical protein